MVVPKISARNVAFMALFATLSVIICKWVPGIPIVGIPETSIKLDAAIAPIYGMVIGPYLGFFAALIGGFIAAESPFSILTSFCPAVSAMVAGFLISNKAYGRSKISGWIPATIILGLLIVGWYATWVGQQAPLYPLLHFAGLFAILITRNWTAKSFNEINVNSSEGWQIKSSYILSGILVVVGAYMFSRPYLSEIWILPYLSLPLYLFSGVLVLYGVFGRGKASFVSSICLASYCGIIADHMLGNIIFISVINILIPLSVVQEYFLKPLGLPNIPSLFMYMVPISAVERIFFTAFATMFGVGIILALYRAGLLPKKS